jgi:hypothetical protein
MAFSTNGTSGGAGLSSEINVTPLIDVLLVMLIIFMVIVPVMPRGLNSALSSSAQADVANNVASHPILVEVEQGETSVRYLVDGVGVEKAEVARRGCWSSCREDPPGRCSSKRTRSWTSALLLGRSMPVRLPEPIASDWSLLELMSSRSRRNVDTLSDVLSDAMESARRCPPAALICRDLN